MNKKKVAIIAVSALALFLAYRMVKKKNLAAGMPKVGVNPFPTGALFYEPKAAPDVNDATLLHV